jgi:hypothetical protein
VPCERTPRTVASTQIADNVSRSDSRPGSRARAAAAVGVAISITTIPAIAYFAVAVVADDYTDSWGALGVLFTSVIALLAAGTVTVAVQRGIRAHQERRAPV